MESTMFLKSESEPNLVFQKLWKRDPKSFIYKINIKHQNKNQALFIKIKRIFFQHHCIFYKTMMKFSLLIHNIIYYTRGMVLIPEILLFK